MKNKIILSFILASILLLTTFSLMNSADALKATGVQNTKFGKDTSKIVCGDKLCSEIEKEPGRGNYYQQEAPEDSLDPLYSFNFDSEQDDVVLDGEDGFLQLDRSRLNIIKIPSNSTNSLKEMTLTAWVKPDFEKSFGEYTIVGKERSFNLYVDNLNYPKKSADFSIFDGISWTTVKSKNMLPEKWFHIGAVYKQDNISLFINGNLVGDVKIKPTRVVNPEGKAVERTMNKIPFSGNLTIGTYIETSSSDGEKFNNMYSGKIDDLRIFSYAMKQSEIADQFKEKSSFYENRVDPIIEVEEGEYTYSGQ